MFWALERLRRILLGTARGNLWKRIKIKKEFDAKSFPVSSSKKRLLTGGRRCARRKYKKLETEMMLDECAINAKNNNESGLTVHQDVVIAADINDITSSETSEAETDPDDDEALTCNVCDRAFLSTHLLVAHQQKRRHYGCSACESVFQTLVALEQHKEEYEHWSDEDSEDMEDSDDDSDSQENCVSSGAIGIVIDEETGLARGPTEEKERLL